MNSMLNKPKRQVFQSTFRPLNRFHKCSRPEFYQLNRVQPLHINYLDSSSQIATTTNQTRITTQIREETKSTKRKITTNW